MNKKILIGSITVVFLIVLASFPSTVAFQTGKSKDEIMTTIQSLKEKSKGGWYPGFFIELIIGTIFILLILLGILTPS
jgi:hypothetical protein